MNKNLRLYYSLALIAVAALFLAACDSGQGISSQPATTSQSSSQSASPAQSNSATPANTPTASTVAPAAANNAAPANTPAAPAKYKSSLGSRGPAAELHSDTWINSGPVSIASLRGKVVIVEFWTFECINCIHALPGLKAVYNKYHSQGLEVIGVHSPEFAAERDIANVKQAVSDMGIPWPVAIDNDFKNWNAYHNGYWPAFYIIDKTGTIRSVRVGEGNDAGLMSDVADLLKEQP